MDPLSLYLKAFLLFKIAGMKKKARPPNTECLESEHFSSPSKVEHSYMTLPNCKQVWQTRNIILAWEEVENS